MIITHAIYKVDVEERVYLIKAKPARQGRRLIAYNGDHCPDWLFANLFPNSQAMDWTDTDYIPTDRILTWPQFLAAFPPESPTENGFHHLQRMAHLDANRQTIERNGLYHRQWTGRFEFAVYWQHDPPRGAIAARAAFETREEAMDWQRRHSPPQGSWIEREPIYTHRTPAQIEASNKIARGERVSCADCGRGIYSEDGICWPCFHADKKPL